MKREINDVLIELQNNSIDIGEASNKLMWIQKNKIPHLFKLFGSTITVVWDNKKMNDLEIYGRCDYGASQIILSTTQQLDKLSNDKILDTFYHEKVHMILDFMNEHELSNNEKFVDIFGKLLRQSDETAECFETLPGNIAENQ